MTLLDALIAALTRAGGEFNRNDQEPPVAILWTDPGEAWRPLLPALRTRLPHLLSLGPYTPSKRTGPAIWLRAAAARRLPEIATTEWTAGTVPILYLAGVGRGDLRGTNQSTSPELLPLTGFQHRAAFWLQRGGRDWTPLAFLGDAREGGLALDVARDRHTLAALGAALEKLGDADRAELAGRRLEASDFRALLSPDPRREVLVWLDHPEAAQERMGAAGWGAFCQQCAETLGFRPDRDGVLGGAELLGRGEGGWEAVWRRYREAPDRYPNLPGQLRRAKPESDLSVREDPWPQVNDAREAELRAALRALTEYPAPAATAEIVRLEAVHGPRRTWVWYELKAAPLARALGHLARMAQVCAQPTGGGDLAGMVAHYRQEGWQVDAAALDALASVRRAEDVEAVETALRTFYGPWLERLAEHFQARVAEAGGLAGTPDPGGALADAGASGTVTLFADGLRYDLAQRLKTFLEQLETRVASEGARWAALPTVTPTAKPAASPVADTLVGTTAPEGGAERFLPQETATSKELTPARFRALLAGRGWQVLEADETGEPSPTARAWTEAGHLDRLGHDTGGRLAWRVDEEIRELAERVRALLDAGWGAVRIITDHGWLLLPGGLPKVELPRALTESRWGRCALLRPGVTVAGLPVVPWRWEPLLSFATPPGIGAFRAGLEYTHGGLSLQECLVPELLVRGQAPATPTAVATIRWVGLRCRVEVAGVLPGLRVDLRTRAGEAASSVATEPRAVDAAGRAALVVVDDGLEGAAATLVLLDAGGTVLARHPTLVGG